MISRLTAVATTFAVVTAVLLAFNSPPRTGTLTMAGASPATAKLNRFIELEPVVVTGKRLYGAPI